MLKPERELVRELQGIYPRPRDFDNSTAVARLNGYVGGNGSREQLAREIDQLGLSEEGKNETQILFFQLNDNVDVALVGGGAPCGRSEKAKPPNAISGLMTFFILIQHYQEFGLFH